MSTQHMASGPDIQIPHLFDTMTKSMAHLRMKETGEVEAQIDRLGTKQSPGPETTKISTTVTECSWNAYSTAKLPKSAQVSNRARLVESTSDGCTFRVGSTIFLPQSPSSSSPFKPFVAPKMSLYIDSIEQRGPYLFVTSRQEVTTIPEPKDEPPKEVDTKATDIGSESKVTEKDVKEGGVDSAKSSTGPEGMTTKEKPEVEKADSSDDDDDSADKIPQPSDDDSSNELSADESWSEGSTEYDSDQKLREFNPRMPPQERTKPSSDSDSNDLESNSDGASSTDSDASENLLEGSDGEGGGLDSDQEDQWWDDFYNDDERNRPDFNNEEDNASDVGEEDDDFPNFQDGGWSYADAYQPMGSDSEECSECGSDGGACAMPPKDITKSSTKNDEEQEDMEEPVGTPMSHIHVYDTSITDDTQDRDAPKRIFHFKRSVGQILASSPPAIHSTQSLMVWPLGDNRILFADYESNTYFVRKFQTSQFWSSHVSVNCHFSDDGKDLHVVALEKSGKPPILPTRKKSKSAGKGTEEASKPKKDTPKYELIISTYRVSESKTTRSPPILVKRVQKDLDELNVLPTIVWKAGQVYVSFTKKASCYVYRVDLRGKPVAKSRRSQDPKMAMRCLKTDLPEWAADREIRFMPADDGIEGGQLIILAEGTKIRSYRPVTTKSSDTTTTITISEDGSKADSAVESSPVNAHTTKGALNGAAIDSKDEASGIIESGSKVVEVVAPRIEDRLTTPHAQKTDANNEPAITTSAPEHKEPTHQTGEIEKKQEKPKSTHPGKMVTTLSADDIESLGGWRDADDSATTESTVDDKSKMEIELMFKPAIEDVDVQIDS